MNEKLTKLQSYITTLWSKHLNANDFKDVLEKHLNESKDWYKTSLEVKDNNIKISLYTDKENGYTFSVKMTKK